MFIIKLKSYLRRITWFYVSYFLKIISNNIDKKNINNLIYGDVLDKNITEKLQELLLNENIENWSKDKIMQSNEDINFNLVKKPDDIVNITKNKKIFGELTLKNPENYDQITNLIFSNNLLSNVKKIIKSELIYNGINVRLSFNSIKNYSNQYLFHRDRDSHNVVKSFIYLTDVTEKEGPFIFLKNSAKENPMEIFKHRYTESFIRKKYDIKNIVKITGGSGTSFTCYTNSFHRQGNNDGNYRLMITFKFSDHRWDKKIKYSKKFFNKCKINNLSI